VLQTSGPEARSAEIRSESNTTVFGRRVTVRPLPTNGTMGIVLGGQEVPLGFKQIWRSAVSEQRRWPSCVAALIVKVSGNT
jgi:hypothetical protein